MTETEIRESLRASIDALADADWTAGVSGYRHCVYLDPRSCEVYQWSHVGPGCPEPVWNGRHKTVFEHATQADLIPSSVVEALLDRIDLLTSVCVEVINDVDVADDFGSAHHELEAWEPELAYYWDPGDWYQDSGHEIETLVAQGHSPEQIVDCLDQGDDYNGRIRAEAAVDWMTDRVDEILTEAVDAIGDADDAETRWDAVSRACALHLVPLLASDPYVQVAAAARDRGHADLADALTDAHCAQAREDRDEGADLGARVCYGCGQAIDPHAGLSVVWCGSCGRAGR